MGDKQQNTIRIGFMGDFGLGPWHTSLLGELGPGFLNANIIRLLKDVDLAIGNFECTILEKKEQSERLSNLYISPDTVKSFNDANNLHFCLANNHIADYGVKGINCTLRTLNEYGIYHFGAGNNYTEAIEPLKTTINGVVVGFICGAEFPYANAKKHRCGSAPLDTKRLIRQIRELKTQCDFVIVILHADEEFRDYPAPYRIRMSRKLVNKGADAVIQHHPHVVQGVEMYKGKIIAYSLGNWAFRIGDYQRSYKQTSYGLFLVLELSTGGSVQQLYKNYHIKINENHCPQLLSETEASIQSERLEKLSRNLYSNRIVNSGWFGTCKEILFKELMNIYYTLRKEGIGKCTNRLRHVIQEKLFWRQLVGLISLGKI